MSLSFNDFFAGWCGGIIGVLVGHPMDTIKVRQQVFRKSQILQTIITTVKQEGVFNLYCGLSFPLLFTGLQSSVFFGVYGNVLRTLQYHQHAEMDRKTCGEGSAPNKHWHQNVYLSGCVAGFAHTILACPVDLIKVKLQVGCDFEEYHKLHLRECIRQIYLSSGVFGFYHGFVATLLRDVPSYGFYVLLYEHLLCVLQSSHLQTGEYTAFNQFLSGGLAGTITWVAVTPLDVVKSRIQADNIINSKYHGVIDCIFKTYKEHGLGTFGRGLSIHIIRGFPVNAATFVGYESFIKLCSKIDT